MALLQRDAAELALLVLPHGNPNAARTVLAFFPVSAMPRSKSPFGTTHISLFPTLELIPPLLSLPSPLFNLLQPTIPVNVHLLSDSVKSIIQISLRQLTLPHYNYSPTARLQKSIIPQITLTIGFNFRLPEINICLRKNKFRATFMTMPETPVYEYAGPIFCQYNVRPPIKPFQIDAVPISKSEQFPPQSDFRFGVLRPDVRHTCVTLLRRKRIGHMGLYQGLTK